MKLRTKNFRFCHFRDNIWFGPKFSLKFLIILLFDVVVLLVNNGVIDSFVGRNVQKQFQINNSFIYQESFGKIKDSVDF